MPEADIAPAPIQWLKWAMVVVDAALVGYLIYQMIPETKKIEWTASINRERKSAAGRREHRRIKAQMEWELNEILTGQPLEVEL